MNRAFQRTLFALTVIGTLVLSTAAAANAAPTVPHGTRLPATASNSTAQPQTTAERPAAGPGWKLTTVSDVSTKALSCNSGNLCVWPVTAGSSSRCSWANRDDDWWNAPVVCSWSSSRPVKAIYNHGTSSTYDGVCLYRGPNQDPNTVEIFVPQGATATSTTGTKLRSHKWVRPTDPC
jgi:hypothetical protein